MIEGLIIVGILIGILLEKKNVGNKKPTVSQEYREPDYQDHDYDYYDYE